MKNFLPVSLWALFIFVLTMTPGKYVPPVNVWDIANLDKLAHLVVFFVLMLLALAGYGRQYGAEAMRLPVVALLFVGCAAYGFLLEVMQGTLLIDRYFEWHDAAANTTGCILGLFFYKFVFIKSFRP